MNNVFKVIWDSSAQCWVAVSELARSKTKSTSDKRAQPSKVLVALGLAGMALSSGSVIAATASEVMVNSQQGSVTSGNQKVMLITDSSSNSIAIGGAAGNSRENSRELKPAEAQTGGTAIGSNSNAGEGSVAISYSANASGNSTVAIGYSAQASGSAAVALGLSSNATGSDSFAVGRNTKTSTNSISIGMSSQSGGDSVAIGHGASTLNKSAAVAIGNHSKATDYQAVAIGDKAYAGHWASAFGAYSNASVQRALAVGYGATASANASSTFGVRSNATAANATALGSYANASGEYSIATGDNSAASVKEAIAIGHQSNVSGAEAIGIGAENTVSGENSGVLGYKNTVSNANTFVLGSNVKSTQDNSVILGANSTDREATVETKANVGGYDYSGFSGVAKAGNGVVSVGFQGGERQIINVAAGNVSATSTDAINGSQLYLVGNSIINQMPVIYTDKQGNKVYKVPQKDNPTTFTFVDEKGQPVTGDIIASMNDGDNQADSPKTLANVKGNLPNTYNANSEYNPKNQTVTVSKEQSLPPSLNVNNAATVGDILNSGWNLKNNGQASDFVKPYDSVDFANGTATTAVVKPAEDGKSTTIQYNVNVDNETITTKEVTDPVTQKPITQLTAKTTTLGDNNQDGKIDDPDPKAKNALVTAENITKAINASGFKLKTSAVEGGEKDKTSTPENGELINPGDSVEMIAGKNLTVKQENGKVTYSTKEEVD
ncbi:MAG: ESPR-type extended signal peptide-containing protein, partial [[Pasteurella] mairii]|nr:ESPR-type extended signal peptide-containing protein [[Pasteurella] mairii]